MRRAALLAVTGLVLLAAPASAENPVLDAETDADVAASLAEATAAQRVCYGYELHVLDQDTGVWGGTYAVSGAGPGTRPQVGPTCADVVELRAQVVYTSSFSEAEDGADWTLSSTLPQLTIADVEDLGLSAGDLLDDGSSERTLRNAVLALPRLAAEQAGRPPLVLEPADASAAPADAAPTNRPGSDWLRENGALLAVCVALLLAGLAMLVLSRRPAYRPLH